MRSNTYEITLKSEVGPALCTEFEDCEITVGSGMTTLRAELPDQAALWGLVQRIGAFGLEVTDLSPRHAACRRIAA